MKSCDNHVILRLTVGYLGVKQAYEFVDNSKSPCLVF